MDQRGAGYRGGGLYTVKKGFRYSRPQPGCHLPNSPWAGIMTSHINYSCPEGVWKVTSRLGTGTSKSFFYGVREEGRRERKGSAGDSRANEQVVGGEENRAAR